MRPSEPIPLVAACGMGDNLWIGDRITLGGRTFTVRGFEPMSVPDRMVELVEVETGVAIRVSVARLRTGGHERPASPPPSERPADALGTEGW